MIKSSASDSDGDKTVHSELHCGGYVISYDKVVLPNYLVQLLSQNDVIVDIGVDEELNERANGGDLDDDARKCDDTVREVELERSRFFKGDNGIDKADEGEMKSVLIHVGETMDPDEVKVPKPLDDWVGPYPNTSKG